MLTIAAVFPAAYLMNYIYKQDKIEKEPASLLIKIFLFGMLSTVPVVIVGTVLEGILGIFVDPESSLYGFFVCHK